MTSQKRRFVRFYPDEGTVAQIDPRPLGGEFNPEIFALVLEESQGGCRLVILQKEFEALSETFTIQVGKLPPVPATIRWDQDIDNKIKKIGVEFLLK